MWQVPLTMFLQNVTAKSFLPKEIILKVQLLLIADAARIAEGPGGRCTRFSRRSQRKTPPLLCSETSPSRCASIHWMLTWM